MERPQRQHMQAARARRASLRGRGRIRGGRVHDGVHRGDLGVQIRCLSREPRGSWRDIRCEDRRGGHVRDGVRRGDLGAQLRRLVGREVRRGRRVLGRLFVRHRGEGAGMGGEGRRRRG